MDGSLEDVTLACIDCKVDFVIPAGEQTWLAEKFGDDYRLPRRCRACRQVRKVQQGEQAKR